MTPTNTPRGSHFCLSTTEADEPYFQVQWLIVGILDGPLTFWYLLFELLSTQGIGYGPRQVHILEGYP